MRALPMLSSENANVNETAARLGGLAGSNRSYRCSMIARRREILA
jgi:hypothetical protein